ncbi:toll/interleukin-1 receptor domain-containing protein [Streptomyces justiciae]|uniref:toll/interleukin-1 receptor domain-containing protein n=1 Tax=Streptomyces justiciae TaxID=2780140 RepID=UPI0021172CAC|nr:toll/interleukin-1 receptor domain-containing protein [Streptomyces justiciae]MCW8381523.1 toll/interleukin-1 receptor domain-containing protein [Streptomyces justiciae]
MEPPSRLEVFLSHRYHSPAENQYFWELLSAVENVSFRVDKAGSFTSPVRLERMIRDADGFVGIHPLPGPAHAAPVPSQLLETAQYFRLELAMAVRARKPAVVFHDQRLLPVLRAPQSVRLLPYDAQEVDAGRHSALPAKVEAAFRGFLAEAHASESAPRRRSHQARRVGVLVPPEEPLVAATLTAALRGEFWEPEVLPWPPRLDLDLIARLRACDWVVIDLDTAPGRLAAAFAHGQFVPTLAIASRADEPVPDVETLYGTSATGHRKAIVRWSDPLDLADAVTKHLKVIDEPPQYIGSAEQAVTHFRSAAKRNEHVFLSYASANGDRAAEFSRLLNGRFQEVFDFREQGAIGVGEDWLDDLIGNLARSAIGVLLLSKEYLESEYCMFEARELHRASIERRVRLVPVCLEKMDLPAFLQGTQYRALYRHTPQEIVTELLSQLPATA